MECCYVSKPNRKPQITCTLLPEYNPGPDLEGLFRRKEQAHVEQSLDWFNLIAAAALPAHEEARIYLVCASPDEMLALPVRFNKRDNSLHALTNFYSSYFDFPRVSRNPGLLLSSLFDFFRRDIGVSEITLSPFPENAEILQTTHSALLDSGWAGTHHWDCFVNWTLRGIGSYSEFLSLAPSRLVNTIQRKKRKFLAEGHGSLSIVTGGAELEEAQRDYLEIFKQRWAYEEPFPNFIPALINLASERGWLRLGLARYRGKTIAAQIWLTTAEESYIFKLAHRPEYKHYSPGTLLTAHLLESALDHDKVTRVDFLSGDDSYKSSWMNTRCTRVGIAAYNPHSLRGTLRLCNHKARKLARKLLSHQSSTGSD